MITTYRSQTRKFYCYIANTKGIMYNLDTTLDTLEYKVTRWDKDLQLSQDVIPYTNVDLTTNNESTGVYFVNITIPNNWYPTIYYIHWKITENGKVTEYKKEFEVIDQYLPQITNDNHLCLINDVKRELGTTSTVTDDRIMTAIIRATAFIQQYCGRVFTTRFETQMIKSEVDNPLLLPEPICTLQTITQDNITLDIESITPYRRHLVSQYGSPMYGNDDRDNPKLEGAFYKNTIYEVTGVFGYSEYDGSPTGKVPEQIRLACINMALKYQASLLGSGDSGASTSIADRIIEEKTATQSYKLSPLSGDALNMLAGDTELAKLLKSYKRPPIISIV